MTVEELLAELRGILSGADDESRELTDEEVERYEELEGKIDATRKREEIRSRQKAYDTPVRPDLGVNVAAVKSDDTLERAYEDYLRTGTVNQDMQELRAQSVGTDSAGGYTAPDGFRTKIVDKMKDFGGIAGLAETITTADGNNLPWTTTNDVDNVGEIVAESGTFSAGADLTFGTANIGAYKYTSSGAGTDPLRVSVELLQDSTFDIAGMVASKLAQRIARIQSTHLAVGSGVDEPLGLVTGLTGVGLAVAADGLTYDDLVEFEHAADPAYRSNAGWVFNDNTLKLIKKMKDADGDPLWRASSDTLGTGTGGGTVLGYPVTIDQGLPDLVPGDATVNWGAFGDIRSGYLIRRVRDITVIVNPYTRASFGEVEYSAWGRMDATQQDTNAYSALTGAA